MTPSTHLFSNQIMLSTMWQARRWTVFEARLPRPDLQSGKHPLPLARRPLAQALLRFWLWPLQHVLAHSRCVRPTQPARRHRGAVCHRRLDPPRPHHPECRKGQRQHAHVPQHILLQLLYEADDQGARHHCAVRCVAHSPTGVHTCRADVPVAPPRRRAPLQRLQVGHLRWYSYIWGSVMFKIGPIFVWFCYYSVRIS